MYWKYNLTKEEITKEVHVKKNYLYLGRRHEGTQISCSYPELDKGNEKFMFWFREKAIPRLHQAIDGGMKVSLYRGSMAQQFYIV